MDSTLPGKALETTPEHPWPVRHLSEQIATYIERMPPVWVEGQIVQLNRRPGARMVFLTLRDADVDMSLPVSMFATSFDKLTAALAEGDRVVVHAKPMYWTKRGTLQLSAKDIRPVGVGELLARLEHLKKLLASEGLFATEHKKPLPFLPRKIGLICGRESKAEHDVVVNARARWPQVRFDIREVAVQGTEAVPQVTAALTDLDADPSVEVIVIARGGGAVEDLLPFSNEALIRAAFDARTPLVSAIGHETDAPILDLVADYRASTPTDAAKRIVPDVAEEFRSITSTLERLRTSARNRIAVELTRINEISSRPALATPHATVERHMEETDRIRTAVRATTRHILDAASHQLVGSTARLQALSPAATLARGYAVVTEAARGEILRAANQVAEGEGISVKLAEGTLSAQVLGGSTAHK